MLFPVDCFNYKSRRDLWGGGLININQKKRNARMQTLQCNSVISLSVDNYRLPTKETILNNYDIIM